VPDAEDLRRRLAERGDDSADRLIAEARAEAVARVRSLLTDAYTDLLLDEVRAALAPRGTAPAHPGPTAAEPPAPTAPAPTPEQAAPPAPAELGWYVYCVVDGDHAPAPADLAGVDPRHPVHALEQDGLAAIVSRVPLDEFGEEPLREHLSDMTWLERTARRHEHVQERMTAAGTPIPMRLCSIYRDESGVRSMLVREGPALRDALDRLRGKAEWGVKAFADLAAAEPAPAVSDPAVSDPAVSDPAVSEPASGQGAAYMQGRIEHRRRREQTGARLDEACDSLHAALCAVADDGVTLSPHRPEMTGRDVPMIFNASYLVADARADAFQSEVDRLRRELAPLGIEVEPTGPWPPYNFVPGTIGAGW
jgi:Gas vesicle synthesis protein GvpL/GvpF